MTAKPFTEKTLTDFHRLFVERFPCGDESLPNAILANPARRGGWDSGTVAYDGNQNVLAIHGLLPRVLWFARRSMMATTGTAFAVRKDAKRDFLTGFLRDSILVARADVFMANTSVRGSRKRFQDVFPAADGPDSCALIREMQLRCTRSPWEKIVHWIWKRMFRILHADNSVLSEKLDSTEFDCFWEKYLAGNRGLVSSRSADELKWMFGRYMARGEVVLKTLREQGELVGYAFLRRTDESAVCWRVVDMIALDNDEDRLERLIDEVARFLCKSLCAECLQITGYPDWLQPMLRRKFPHVASFGYNKCIWAYLNNEAKALCGDWVSDRNSWYGCPYDGDMAMA